MSDGTTVTVVLDDVDVTALAVEGTITRRLNRVSTASVRINMQKVSDVFGTTFPGAGSYLKVYLSNATYGSTPYLFHHGRILNCETTANEDTGYTVFNSSDPLELWQWRPVRDSTGDFSDPTIVADNIFGPSMIQDMCINSECRGGALTPPADCEGPLRLDLNSFAGGVTSLEGAPQDWPMTMAEFAALLISTGVVDVVITPIEFDVDDNYGRLDVYNGDYGLDLTSSVAFQYGMGAYNVRALRWNEDMTNLTNKLWYYLGPRIDANHWPTNITGTDLSLAYPPGGALSPPAAALNNQLGVRRYQSQREFDIRMDIQIFDTDRANSVRELYKRQFQMESWLRAEPVTLVHITPARDVEIGNFDIGDIVLVEAAPEVKGGFSGAQRIYSYSISWDAAESVPALSELQVSSDAEGF